MINTATDNSSSGYVQLGHASIQDDQQLGVQDKRADEEHMARALSTTLKSKLAAMM